MLRWLHRRALQAGLKSYGVDMALYPNGRHLTKTAGRFFGPTSGSEVYTRMGSSRFNRFLSETAREESSFPDGYGIKAIVQPRVSGGISTGLSGSGAAGGDAILALELLATILAEGGITADGGLIVNLIATIAGSGRISNADMQAFLNLLAAIAGAGGIAATATGIGGMAAQVSGAGSINPTATGLGSMAATIRGYGDLTPEGLRDAVWDALAAQYDKPGTTGAKLNAAGSGGVDLNALAAAVWAYASRSLTGAQADQLRELFEIHGLDPAKPLQVTDTARTAGAISQTVASSAPPSGVTVAVTRLP